MSIVLCQYDNYNGIGSGAICLKNHFVLVQFAIIVPALVSCSSRREAMVSEGMLGGNLGTSVLSNQACLHMGPFEIKFISKITLGHFIPSWQLSTGTVYKTHSTGQVCLFPMCG